MNYSKIETEKMMTFATSRANRTTVPLPVADLWREYIELGMSTRSLLSLCNKFRKLMEDLHYDKRLSFETKLRLLFAFSVPVHTEFIELLEESADYLEMSDKNVILKYTSRNLNLAVKKKDYQQSAVQKYLKNNQLERFATPTSSMAPVDVMDILRPLRRIITILRSIKLHRLLHNVVNAINSRRHKNIPIHIVEMALKNIFSVVHFTVGDQEYTTSLKYFLKIFRTMILEINLEELFELQKNVEAGIQKAERKDKKIPTSNIVMGLEAAFILVNNGQYYSFDEPKLVEKLVKIEEIEEVKPQISLLFPVKSENDR